jgi:hypothetical protein
MAQTIGAADLNRPGGNFDEAARHFNEALRLKPDHAAAHNLGVIAQRDAGSPTRWPNIRLRSDFSRLPDAHYNLGIDLQASDAQTRPDTNTKRRCGKIPVTNARALTSACCCKRPVRSIRRSIS